MMITNKSNYMLWLIVLAIALAGCAEGGKQEKTEAADKAVTLAEPLPPATHPAPVLGSGDVFVHLFEWQWLDVARECEEFLGPNGYAAVQISPPQEHVPGPEWWTRYQPVSYKIESRGGTRAEFAEMVSRCKAAGVDVYADALTNHMAGIGQGTGVAGSKYSEYTYPVPYGRGDFHHCGRNGNDSIANYQDLWEVQNCNLGTLADLDTSNPTVQKKIAGFLQDLVDLGVAGFRLDAVKHVAHQEVTEILGLLEGRPFLFQEVIDRGGEPIDGSAYTANGHVTEFKYPIAMHEAFSGGQLASLSDLDSRTGFLAADKAVVFVDNHDLQRGHAGGDRTLTHKDGALYDLANVFMLGWPYGYPKVMSSYHFDDSDQGPPSTRPVENGVCTADWVCEHRRADRAGMIAFRQATRGLPVTNWQASGEKVISFGRGDKAHLIINAGTESSQKKIFTGMQAGAYCDLIASGLTDNGCESPTYQVDSDGFLEISIAPMTAVAICD